MWKNKNRMVIWSLDNLLNLEDIKELLEKKYNYTIDFLADYDIDDYDKELRNEWISTDDDEIRVEEMDILGKNFRYISALGKYETNYGEARSFVNGELLPRSVRIFNHAVKVVFFEYLDKVYCVLEITKSQETRVRSALFGQRRGNKIEDWGTIESNTPLPFVFSSKFYYWLFSQKGHTLCIEINDEDYNLEVIDVAAVSHLADREAYDSSSMGADLLSGSIPALSGLGSNEDVYQAGFKLSIQDCYLLIKLGANGICVVDSRKSYYMSESEGTESIELIDSNFEYFSLIIYGVIFPNLLQKYDEQKSEGLWDDFSENSLRKTWAIKVIKELTTNNDISLEELEPILESVSIK